MTNDNQAMYDHVFLKLLVLRFVSCKSWVHKVKVSSLSSCIYPSSSSSMFSGSILVSGIMTSLFFSVYTDSTVMSVLNLRRGKSNFYSMPIWWVPLLTDSWALTLQAYSWDSRALFLQFIIDSIINFVIITLLPSSSRALQSLSTSTYCTGIWKNHNKNTNKSRRTFKPWHL